MGVTFCPTVRPSGCRDPARKVAGGWILWASVREGSPFCASSHFAGAAACTIESLGRHGASKGL